MLNPDQGSEEGWKWELSELSSSTAQKYIIQKFPPPGVLIKYFCNIPGKNICQRGSLFCLHLKKKYL